MGSVWLPLLVVSVSILAAVVHGHSVGADNKDRPESGGSINLPSIPALKASTFDFEEQLRALSGNADMLQLCSQLLAHRNNSSSDSNNSNTTNIKNPTGNINPTNNNGGYNSSQPNNVSEEAHVTTPPPQGNCICVPIYLCNGTNDYDENGFIDIDGQGGSSDQCDSYIKKCCEPQNIISSADLPTTKPPLTKRCGKRNVDLFGFTNPPGNDSEAQYGEFPWMMAIIQPNQTISSDGKTGNVYQCGGSLIHPQVVLTGGHCVQGKNNLLVRAGEWDTQTSLELYPTQDLGVQEVITHENYNNGSLRNDLALLILDHPVNMTLANVGLICLPEQGEDMDHRDCVASGWGKDTFGQEGKYQVILKRVDIPTVPRGPCQETLRKTRLGSHFKLHESFLCAGGIVGKDTCKGDGGSPLACPSKSDSQVYIQAGIVAWGISCGTETPGVYANVPYFVDWITNKLQEKGFSLGSSYDT